MNIKDFIKKRTVDSNIYLLNIKCILSDYRKYRKVNSIIRKVTNIDSILEYDLFYKVMQPILKQKEILLKIGVGSESMHYGHLNAFYEYADFPKKPNSCVFPAVEHAIKFDYKPSRSDEEIYRYSNFVYQSTYMKGNVHAINPMKPVFCIGSYLQYVKGIYSKEVIDKLKNKYGKTIIVFPSHTLEQNSHEMHDQDIVTQVYQIAEEGQFNTVLVSVYWADMDWKVYRDFKNRGAILVSSGYREDPMFIQRQKSLFELADLVIANNIATPVGFALDMNIPVKLVVRNSDINENIMNHTNVSSKNHILNYQKLFYLMNKNELSKKECEIMEELKYYFCGSRNLSKSKQEMFAILEICNDIMKYSKGNFSEYDNAVSSLLEIYKKICKPKYELLKEAIK